ncbi:MAG: 23S rRNA (pseudouridine(1915)-N(3))-methyltransferase RlmH [Bacteroidales bacterium]|nr:23S rRNA (pseudouridine(1915)-N(3))-methyltransferase RlmH [Bacteroidales bacterium]
MRITLIQSGKTRDHFIEEGVSEFSKRLVRYAPFRIETIPDLKNSRNMTMKEVRGDEGRLLLKRIKDGDYVILLDERGNEYNSISFAEYLNALEGKVNRITMHNLNEWKRQ